MTDFVQPPPVAGNRFRTDPSLRLALAWRLPDDMFEQAKPALERMGRLADETMHPLAAEAEARQPQHTPYDAWGRRIDRIDVDASWQELVAIGQREGLVALPHEAPYGEHSRLVQAGLIHLYDPASAVADCPLVMTDGAISLLREHDPALADRYVPRLTARENAWTSGQWMTEKTGGSDVSATATAAYINADGSWSLHGTKWFTSAATSDMALALARPDGAESGNRGLSLFLIELRDAQGDWNGIQVRRLKDKLGTRALPTAEVDLVGARALPVGALGDGVRKLTGLLNIARFWAAIGGPAGVGHLLALARDYAHKRVAFGRPLAQNAVHRRWLARIAAQYDAMLMLNLETACHQGRMEHGGDGELARLLAPLNKLACARQSVTAASELLESFGGAGYLEDTGIPRIFRNLHVHCIWEGTTSVLAHDVLRALAAGNGGEAFADEIARRMGRLRHEATAGVRHRLEGALDTLMPLINDPVEAGARRIAWGMAKTYQALLLAEFAEWRFDTHGDRAGFAAAEIFAGDGLVDAPFPNAQSATLDALAFGRIHP
ncbi:acyl-CoA dehydrogenase family protein [Arhodomonas sp. AD133]|uniref:acyl-CoA dehydrogenase family protein n=1 Tax=Arhodomonas sp. AD133 TaxID=3415009 RepID=UPI003EB8E452